MRHVTAQTPEKADAQPNPQGVAPARRTAPESQSISPHTKGDGSPRSPNEKPRVGHARPNPEQTATAYPGEGPARLATIQTRG